MTHSRWALLSALAASLFAADSYAQGLRQPASARQTAYDYEYNNYYAQGDESTSPSDTVAPPKEEAAEAAPADAAAASCGDATHSGRCEPACGCESSCCDSCCDDGCGCGGGLLTLGGLIDPCCTLDEPCKLFDCCALSSRDITVAGWAGGSFMWNTSDPDDRFNGPVTFTDRSNEFQLNQFYLYGEKATSADSGCWEVGGRIDALYGSDYRFTTAAGLETEGYFQNPVTNGDHRFYGLAMPQAYVQFRKGDFWVNVGHLYAPVGYEGVMATSPTNFFPTHPYTHQYAEPFTLTGVVANYTLNEDWTIGGGFTRGWDNWGGGEDYRNPHLGGVVTATRTLEKGSLALAWVFGPEQTLEVGYFQNRFLQTAVWTRPLEDDVTFVLQSDLGYQNDAYGRNGKDAWWYGLNGYLLKKISDCWTWGLNAEWFRDEEGTRVGGFLGTTDTGSLRGLSGGRFGYDGNFYQVSLGANWHPNANWNVRPAVRFDWYDGNENQFNADGKPFDDGNGNSQTLLGFDAIYSY